MKHLEEYTSLTERGTFAVLCALADAPEHRVTMNALKSCLPNFQTLRERLRLMTSEGLTDIETVYVNKKTTWISATKKGISVADKVSVLASTVGGGTEPKDNVLNQRYSDYVLRSLRTGPKKLSYFDEIITNFRTMESLAEMLEQSGLVTITTVEAVPRNYREMALTPLGTGVAEVLEKLYMEIVADRKPYSDVF